MKETESPLEEKAVNNFIFLLTAVNTLNFFDRQLFGVITEPLRFEWQLSDFQIGFLATAFTLLYAVVGLPIGYLADRFPRQTILRVGLFCWSLLTALCGFAWNFWSLFLLRLGVGVGEASCAPAATSLIGDLVPSPYRARALSVFMIGLPLGSALSYSLGGFLAGRFGWRSPFFIAGMAGLPLALFWKTVSEKRKKDPIFYSARQEGITARNALGHLWRLPAFRWIIVSGAIHNFNLYALSAFLPAFLIRYHQLDIKTAGFVTGLAYAALGGVGMILGGHAADRLTVMKNRSASRLFIAFCSTLLSVPFLFMALSCKAQNIGLFALYMAPAALLLYVYYPSIYASIQDIVPSCILATAMAFYFLVMYCMGASLGPAVVGWLSDYFRERSMPPFTRGPIPNLLWAKGLQRAMYLVPALNILLVFVLGMATLAAGRSKNKKEEGTE